MTDHGRRCELRLCQPPRAGARGRRASKFPRGRRVALIGKTGSGKSTLADLLMGLHRARRRADHDRRRSAYARRTAAAGSAASRMFRRRSSLPTPASRGTSRSAFAGETVDLDRVRRPGERRSSTSSSPAFPRATTRTSASAASVLSGGQRQRLGIARAIYKQAPVLVLDEATSALDDATEAAVMHALDQLGEEGRTIIMIAHRLSTIARADIVVRLDNGRVVEIGHSEAAAPQLRVSYHGLRQIPTYLPAHSVTANGTPFSPTNSANRILSWMSSEMNTPPGTSASQISGYAKPRP